MKLRALGIGAVLLAAWVGSASADLVYLDVFLWYNNGRVVQQDVFGNIVSEIRAATPGGPPPAILIKVEEDVFRYDPIYDPDITPGKDRYRYLITSFYDSGNVPYTYIPQYLSPPTSVPGVGVNYVSEFDIENVTRVPYTNQGLPPTNWVMGLVPGDNISWDVLPPDLGVLHAHDDFYFEVTTGLPGVIHGVVPAWVASHDASGAVVNYMTGFVSGPVGPVSVVPGTWGSVKGLYR